MSGYSILVTDDNCTRTLPEVVHMAKRGLATGPVKVSIGRETRNDAQNRCMWALLNDFAKTVTHCGQKYDSKDWKNLLTATFEGETRYAPALDGKGVIALGAQTSKYSKARMSEFIEFIYATGADMGAVWSLRASQLFDEHGNQVRAA